jgi:predicted RNA-binding protein with PUA-like domain
MNYWLIKSEPDCYSIDDLKKDKKTSWNGVRNYQARNFMRDQMKVGDMALFHHSSTKIPGVCGVAKVVSAPHPDASAFDTKDEHYDAKSKKENPTWICVDFAFVEKLPRLVSLEEIKRDHKLTGIMVAQTGSRLSIQPVSKAHFERILDLAKK